jgi:hypothetical protein
MEIIVSEKRPAYINSHKELYVSTGILCGSSWKCNFINMKRRCSEEKNI